MKKAILKVGEYYVTDKPINFGYTTLALDIKDAKVFDSFDDASNYGNLLAFDCEIISKENKMEKMKTIEENNRLIAEFMGIKVPTKNGDEIERLAVENGDEMWYAHELNYHSDWNWLMPCVVQCFNVLEEGPSGELTFKLNDALLETNINSLYEIVVEVAEWYNENQRKDGND